MFVTNHKEFFNLDVEYIASKMRQKIVIDTRNFIDKDKWKKLGFKIITLGISKIK